MHTQAQPACISDLSEHISLRRLLVSHKHVSPCRTRCAGSDVSGVDKHLHGMRWLRLFPPKHCSPRAAAALLHGYLGSMCFSSTRDGVAGPIQFLLHPVQLLGFIRLLHAAKRILYTRLYVCTYRGVSGCIIKLELLRRSNLHRRLLEEKKQKQHLNIPSTYLQVTCQITRQSTNWTV